MTPEQQQRARERRREYSQRPDIKERARKHQREYMREYNKDPERRKRNAERARKWYWANRDEFLARCRQKYAEAKQAVQVEESVTEA